MNFRQDTTRNSLVRDDARNAFSLLELLVVITILMATAILVMPLFSPNVVTQDGKVRTPNEITTESTMQVIRDAIVGEEGVMENLAHQPDALPREISDLVKEDAPTHVKATAPELSTFNPFFGIGWRGPYLNSTGKDEEGKPTVVDGWGRPFELQVDFDSDGQVDEEESRYIRVVSAGPNGEIETPSDEFNMKPGIDGSNQLTKEECGDDLVMFFCVPDDRH